MADIRLSCKTVCGCVLCESGVRLCVGSLVLRVMCVCVCEYCGLFASLAVGLCVVTVRGCGRNVVILG